MKNNCQRIPYLFCLILLLASILTAQTENQNSHWTTIESPKKDLSFTIPSNFLADNSENRRHFVFASQNKVMMSVIIEETDDAKSRLGSFRKPPAEDDFKVSQFKLGDFIGYIHKSQKENDFHLIMYAASSKSFCTLSVSSKETSDAAIDKFIQSVKLNGQPLFEQNQKIPSSELDTTAVSISSLKTDPIILEALTRKGSNKREIKYGSLNSKEIKDERDYSRPMIVLRRPFPSYTDNARRNWISGTVKLKVLFLANGEIGNIIILTKLGEGLDRSAANAASEIKFLPAEIDGKPVDTEKEITYNFVIY